MLDLIFRTCDAFKIEKLYLCGITATPPNRKITKTAIGANESVEWVYNDNIYDPILELKNQGFKVWAIEQTENSKTLYEMEMIEINSKHVLIFGNELNGVEDKMW
jgi:rRNA methylases